MIHSGRWFLSERFWSTGLFDPTPLECEVHFSMIFVGYSGFGLVYRVALFSPSWTGFWRGIQLLTPGVSIKPWCLCIVACVCVLTPANSNWPYVEETPPHIDRPRYWMSFNRPAIVGYCYTMLGTYVCWFLLHCYCFRVLILYRRLS